MSLKLFYDDISFRFRGWKNVRSLIGDIIVSAGKIPGNISIIITNDIRIKAINIEFLGHDYLTDVITFDYNEGNVVSGEVYISIETVQRNAQNYDVSLLHELNRVVIHGVLHLTGHDDRTEIMKARMHNMEDVWLRKLEEK